MQILYIIKIAAAAALVATGYAAEPAAEKAASLAELRASASAGDAAACLDLGYALEKGRLGLKANPKAAGAWYEKAANTGDPVAQYRYAIYLRGSDEVPANFRKSYRYAELSAKSGNANAQYLLGLSAYNGDGHPKDSEEAVRWYRLAAESGHVLAQYNLGWMLENGVGVPADLVEAHAWWNLASASGHADARFNLGVIEQKMSKGDLAKAIALARSLFAKIHGS